MKTINDISNKLSQSISIKIGVIVFLILLLLIPANMIRSLISERMFTRDQVVNEVSDKWGLKQNLRGPVLVMPYYEKTIVNDEEYISYKQLFILPESLNVTGQVNPAIRYRGMYKVIVYGSDLNINGNFIIPDFESLGIQKENVYWEKARVIFGVTDMRGIQNELLFTWQDSEYSVDPGIKDKHIATSGFTAGVPLSADMDNYRFSFHLDLNGSKGLYFTPVGKTTRVKLRSDWTTPSFSGSFLPDTRDISDSGFTASWSVLHLNRNYPQYWIDKAYDLTKAIDHSSPINEYGIENSAKLPGSAFGVNLLFEVDEYQKSMRSAKYAVMFIALTFLMYIMVEIINKKRIHPVQYLLVSFALLLFYTLLLSLAEHVGFNFAYLISATAIISLISAYSHSIFKSIRITMLSSLSIVVLYVFLFVILQMEDLSLLLGSIGLFIILGIVMYLSKKVNWYGQLRTSNTSELPTS